MARKTEKEHNAQMNALIQGKTVAVVQFMTARNAHELGLANRPLIIKFTDGSMVFPISDEEMNDGGGMLYQDPSKEEVIYTL